MDYLKIYRNFERLDSTHFKLAERIAKDIIVDILHTIKDKANSDTPSFNYSDVSKQIVNQFESQIKRRNFDLNYGHNLVSSLPPQILIRDSYSVRERLPFLSSIRTRTRYRFAQNAVKEKYLIDAYEIIDNIGFTNASSEPYKHLNLHLKKVYCSDETGTGIGEWGKDEINFGGVVINEIGEEKIIQEFRVKDFSDESDSGRIKLYPGLGKVIHTYPLINRDLNIHPFSYIYHTYFTICEKDSTGFAKFLSLLWKAVEPQVKKVLIQLGATIGAGIGSFGGPVGVAIGAILGIIVGAIVDFIINTFKDDVFTPQITSVSLPSFYEDFNGSTSSPFQSFYFNQHNGAYIVQLCWSLGK